MIGHIDTVAKLGRAGTIYAPLNPYTPFYYSRSDLRFAYKPGVWVSVNDRVEFSAAKLGDKYYARNITYPGGKPLRPYVIKPTLGKLTNYWSLSINSNHENVTNYDRDILSGKDVEDTRIRASSVIHPKQRTWGIVISKMKDGYGWILCNVHNSLPIRYHITQIQAVGMKKLPLHSRVEFNVIKGRYHDWSFYITKPGGNLITFEKPDIYGQWLRSLELYGRRVIHDKDKEIYTGFVCEYSLQKQVGFITPFDDLSKRYMFHIDNCNTAKCENRRVFINDEVTFQLQFKEKTKRMYAVNLCSLNDKNGIIHGKHWNWSKMLPYNRKYSYSSGYLHECVSKLDEVTRYRGLVEFNAYQGDPSVMYAAKIYFDEITLYPRTLRMNLNELQCTDVKYIARGTRVEFSLNIDTEKMMITGVRNITAPNGRLLTYLTGEVGEFFRWRNINCDTKLPSILNEVGDEVWSGNVSLIGFIRHLDVKGNFGVIEIISNNACYEPVFFWYNDVLFERKEVKDIKVASVVEFNITINRQCYLHKSHLLNRIKRENVNGNTWAQDPICFLTAQAINIVSYGYDKYLNDAPSFKMADVRCLQ